jgi:hypothetical protein
VAHLIVEYARLSPDGKHYGKPMWAHPTVEDALNVLLDDAEGLVASGDRSYAFEVRKYREMLKLLNSRPRRER